jgi:hypothetical protein
VRSRAGASAFPSSRQSRHGSPLEDGQRRRKEAEARLADLAQWGDRPAVVPRRGGQATVPVEGLEGALQGDGGKDVELGRQVIKKLLSTPVSANPTEAGTWEWTTVGTFEGMLKGYVGTIRAALLASCQRGPVIAGGSDAQVGGGSESGSESRPPCQSSDQASATAFAGALRASGGWGAISVTRPGCSLLMCTPFSGTILTTARPGRPRRAA